MQKKKSINHSQVIDEIGVSVFKSVNILFPGDLYLLATWIAMSDIAKSTTSSKRGTTLVGLANSYISLYGSDYDNPISKDDIIELLKQHGIMGNPVLRFDVIDESMGDLLKVAAALLSAERKEKSTSAAIEEAKKR